MKPYKWIISLKDKASPALERIARSASRASGLLYKFSNLMKRASFQNTLFARTARGVWNGLTSIRTAIATAGIGIMVGQVFNATAEMQKYEAVLTNTFQSIEKGQQSMDALRDFATETPFQINELTDSYVKLVNRGFAPTLDMMTQMGDLASSQGKSYNQLVEAILDAETAEFERLKEFGIKANKAGDQVSFTFKGVTKTVDANAKSIRTALLEYGKMEGVAGSMSSIMDTLGGKLSNVKDKFFNFLNDVGEKIEPLLTSGLEMAAKAMDFVSTNLEPTIFYFKQLWSITLPLRQAIGSFVSKLFPLGEGGLLVAINEGTATFASYLNVLSIGLAEVIGWLEPVAPLLRWIAIGAGIASVASWAFASPWIAIPLIFAAVVGAIKIAYDRVGWFRGGIDAAWTAIKGFGGAIKNYIINRIQGFVKGIGNVASALLALFNRDFKKAAALGKEAFLNLTPIGAGGKLIDEMKTVGKESSKAYHQGVAEAAENNANNPTKGFGLSDFVEKAKNNTALPTLDLSSSDGGNGNAPNASTNSSRAAAGITGGGSKQTNISITIGKLNENFTIQTTNIKEGASEMRDIVQAELLRVVNSVNQMQTG